MVKLSAVDDVGTVVNPLTLEGQLHGSTAQGLGETLLEQVIYERGSGQLHDGIVPGLRDAARGQHAAHRQRHPPGPDKLNPLGVKGGSETGNVGAPAAIINAIVDALSPYKVTDVPMPATPERIWRLIQSAGEGQGEGAD